jgi:succinate dehydrogenase hydrophobic anchor subunit
MSISGKNTQNQVIRKNYTMSASLTKQFTFWFMRFSGLLLLFIALFHLAYTHFIIPGGITHITYQTIAARWTDPVWGFSWRFFDLLLLSLTLTHGVLGIRSISYAVLSQKVFRLMAFVILIALYLVLLGGSAWIIFTFQGHVPPQS